MLRGDYVLLGKRAASIPSGGRWALVGGSVDDESAHSAACRELSEEVGFHAWSLDNINFWADDTSDPNNPYVCVFFGIEVPLHWQPALMEPDKCDGWAWFKITDMPDGMMAGGDVAARLYYDYLNPGQDLI